MNRHVITNVRVSRFPSVTRSRLFCATHTGALEGVQCWRGPQVPGDPVRSAVSRESVRG